MKEWIDTTARVATVPVEERPDRVVEGVVNVPDPPRAFSIREVAVPGTAVRSLTRTIRSGAAVAVEIRTRRDTVAGERCVEQARQAARDGERAGIPGDVALAVGLREPQCP